MSAWIWHDFSGYTKQDADNSSFCILQSGLRHAAESSLGLTVYCVCVCRLCVMVRRSLPRASLGIKRSYAVFAWSCQPETPQDWQRFDTQTAEQSHKLSSTRLRHKPLILTISFRFILCACLDNVKEMMSPSRYVFFIITNINFGKTQMRFPTNSF